MDSSRANVSVWQIDKASSICGEKCWENPNFSVGSIKDGQAVHALVILNGAPEQEFIEKDTSNRKLESMFLVMQANGDVLRTVCNIFAQYGRSKSSSFDRFSTRKPQPKAGPLRYLLSMSHKWKKLHQFNLNWMQTSKLSGTVVILSWSLLWSRGSNVCRLEGKL